MTDFKRNISFETAKKQFPHRFTMDNVPEWSQHVRSDGTFYAPHFASDQEWYDNYRFPGDEGLHANTITCELVGRLTWPLGQYLTAPFSPEKVTKISEVTFAVPGKELTTLRLSRELTPQETLDVINGNVTEEFKATLPETEGLYGKVATKYSFDDGKVNDYDMEADVFTAAILGHKKPEQVNTRKSEMAMSM